MSHTIGAIQSSVINIPGVTATSGSANQIAVFSATNVIGGSSALTWDGSQVLVGGTVRATGLGINASPSSTNIANFVSNQNASTRMILSNTTVGGSADARFYLTSSTDNLFLAVDSEAAIVSGSSFSALSLSQSGSKPINLKTNGNTNLSVSGAGLVTIGTASDTTTTHAINGAVATSASAGAQTLPANPVGFLTLTINGTARKIAYYAT